MSRFQRWLLKTARTVHVYLTLFGLTLILFFAVTGFMLNHTEWFLPDDAALKSMTRKESRPLPLTKLPYGKVPDESELETAVDAKLCVVEALRKEFGVRGEMSSCGYVTETVPEPEGKGDKPAEDGGDKQSPAERKVLKVEFLRAGGKAVATIDPQTAMTEVETEYQGFAIVLTDLHRGNRGNMTNEVKRTGTVWSFVIDGTCVMLLIISVTGLIMWWSLKSRGKWGAVLFLAGTVLTLFVYAVFVP
ncbi:MAG: PepSY-associated TM helix domain-containing protein [Gemmataceae bacterium]|nr:PepSY-associated TM helix domain-containing protein [Gemmataceae bacterium]